MVDSKEYKICEDSVISFEYEVKDHETNELIDSNVGVTPLTFLIGKGQIISGLESSFLGKNSGDSFDAVIEPKNAYGEYDENAMQVLPREQFDGIELKEGMTLYGQDDDGNSVPVVVKKFSNTDVTVDFNHPLAGKTLNFSVSVLNVRKASQDELSGASLAENQTSGGCGCSSNKSEDSRQSSGGGCCGGGHH